MKHRSRLAWVLIGLGLVAVLGLASALGPASTPSRSERLAQEIRCPTCAGLSAAESTSPLATFVREEIDRQVQEGRTDDDIRSYFVSRYGDSALMTPERRGIGLVAWGIPIVAGAAAACLAAYTVQRWKSRAVPELDGFEAEPRENAEVIDLREASQVEAAVSASGAHSTSVFGEVASSLAGEASPLLPDAPSDEPPAATPVSAAAEQTPLSAPITRKPASKWWIAVAIALVFAVIAGFVLVESSEDRETTLTTPQLLAQAQRQSSEGNAADALRSYDEILEREPNNATALAYRGWLIRIAGLPEEGMASIERAIVADPNYPDAHFFKGIILLRDRKQPAAAIPELEQFLASNPPPETASLVQQALQDARNQSASTTTQP